MTPSSLGLRKKEISLLTDTACTCPRLRTGNRRATCLSPVFNPAPAIWLCLSSPQTTIGRNSPRSDGIAPSLMFLIWLSTYSWRLARTLGSSSSPQFFDSRIVSIKAIFPGSSTSGLPFLMSSCWEILKVRT